MTLVRDVVSCWHNTHAFLAFRHYLRLVNVLKHGADCYPCRYLFLVNGNQLHITKMLLMLIGLFRRVMLRLPYNIVSETMCTRTNAVFVSNGQHLFYCKQDEVRLRCLMVHIYIVVSVVFEKYGTFQRQDEC